MKRLEYQKISEQKTGAEQELKKLQEEYRVPLENMEKRQAVLEELFRKDRRSGIDVRLESGQLEWRKRAV